jgi:hypothetical protein
MGFQFQKIEKSLQHSTVFWRVFIKWDIENPLFHDESQVSVACEQKKDKKKKIEYLMSD